MSNICEASPLPPLWASDRERVGGDKQIYLDFLTTFGYLCVCVCTRAFPVLRCWHNLCGTLCLLFFFANLPHSVCKYFLCATTHSKWGRNAHQAEGLGHKLLGNFGRSWMAATFVDCHTKNSEGPKKYIVAFPGDTWAPPKSYILPVKIL